MMKSLSIASAAALSMAASMAHGADALNINDMHVIPTDGYRPNQGFRVRTGWKYPHSSARQQARYARQIAAGQLKFTR